MGGRSAHDSNWYCPNKNCPPEADARIAELEGEIGRLREALRQVSRLVKECFEQDDTGEIIVDITGMNDRMEQIDGIADAALDVGESE